MTKSFMRKERRTMKCGRRILFPFFQPKMFRIVTCFLFFAIQVSATALAQTITWKAKNQNIEAVLKQLRQLTGYDVLGDLSLIRGGSSFSIDFNKTPVETALKQLSDGQPFDLIVLDNTIVIKAKSSKRSEISKPVETKTKAPQRPIKGTIKSSTGRPLSGATVSLQGNPAMGTVTDTKGYFEINVSENAMLEISMVGHKPITISTNKKQNFELTLEEAVEELEDIVVTGYSRRAKESFTGASTTITRKDLEKFNTNNIFTVLSSIDPAFKLGDNTLGGSNPNVLAQITIRGTNSVGEYAVNAPLVIVDGLTSTMENLYDLDVNRIETISILKDASSTVLYGSRGGNGVIIVETRLPKDGKFTVTYEVKPSITAVDLSDYNLMNAAEKLEYEKLAGVYTSVSTDEAYRVRQQTIMNNIYSQRQLNILSGVNTDWLAQPINTNVSTAHSLRIEGGNESIRYSLDGNYNDFKGAVKESGRIKTGAGFNLVYRIPNKIMFRNYANFQSTKAYNSPYGKFNLYTYMNPYERIYDDAESLIKAYNEDFLAVATNKTVGYNPLYNAGLLHRDYQTDSKVSNTLFFEWYISDKFIFNTQASLQKSFVKGEYYKSPKNTDFIDSPVEEAGYYRMKNGDEFLYEVKAQVTYAENIGKHAINASLIGELTDKSQKEDTHGLIGFADDTKISPNYAFGFHPIYGYVRDPSRLVGTLLTGNYTYDKRYVLDASYRMDGSSKFGESNRYSSFWSTGLGWNIHHEKFFDNSFVSLLRLFANTGVTGSDSFRADMTNTAYSVGTESLYYNLIGLEYINEGNAELRWPRIKSFSAGLLSKFWKDRLTFNFSYYKKITNRMVTEIEVAPSLGMYKNHYFENVGKTQNVGFESSLSVKAYENVNKNFSWYVSGSLLQNRSKLLEISKELEALNKKNLLIDQEDGTLMQTVHYQEGQSLNTIKGVPSLGIDPNTGREVFRAKDGSVTYNYAVDNIQIIGDKEPRYFGTLSTMINYQRLSIQAYFNYSMNGDVYNKTLMSKIENAKPQLNGDKRILEDRWKEPGDIAQFKAINNTEVTNLSSRFVQNENYLHFSSLNINYDFNKSLITKYKLERLRVNFSMNDLFRVSTVRMERGTDYPFARTFNFGLMIQF